MNVSDLSVLIKGRRSIRSWQDKPVPENLLLQAVELATYAPNAGNQQNWRFFVILKHETISSIASAVQKNADLMASWPEAAKLGDAAIGMMKRSGFFGNAPALIALGATQYQSPIDQLLELKGKIDSKAGEIREWRTSGNSKIQSVSSAIAYLLLILHQMELGAVWMTGPLQAKGEIEKILKMPAGMDLVALIPVGYPAEKPPLKERKPVNQVSEIIK
jgi:nitroreductase